MLAPAVAAIKAYLAAGFSSCPVRWQNEDFKPPVDNGRPAIYLEAEIIGGRNALEAFGKPGSRLFIHPGLIRFYVLARKGSGIEAALTIADELSLLFQRAEFGRSGDQLVRTQDFSVYDGVASVEDGNYFVLMTSVPFDFYYAG